MPDQIRVYIYTTHYQGYGGYVFTSREDGLGKNLPSLLLRKKKYLSPILVALITMMVKKYVLGLLNAVTSGNNRYQSYKQASVEIIRAVTGGKYSPMPITF